MKTSLFAALIASSASAAMAGGYNAPVVEAEPAAPVVVETAEQPSGEWTGFYAGLQFGKTEAELEAPAGFTPSSIDLDAKNFGIHAGYLRDFGRFVGGAELSYDKLNDFEIGGIDLDDFGDVDGSLLRAKLLAGYDAGQILPYAAISLANISLEIDGEDGDETGFGFGLGVKYMATPRVLIGAEWMRNNFDIDDVDADVDTLSVNASYRF